MRPSGTLYYAAYLVHVFPTTVSTLQVFVTSWDAFISPAYETRVSDVPQTFPLRDDLPVFGLQDLLQHSKQELNFGYESPSVIITIIVASLVARL